MAGVFLASSMTTAGEKTEMSTQKVSHCKFRNCCNRQKQSPAVSEKKVQKKKRENVEETSYLFHFSALREHVLSVQPEGEERRENSLTSQQQKHWGFYLRQEAVRTERWPQRRQLTWQLLCALSSPSSSKCRTPRCRGREECHRHIRSLLTGAATKKERKSNPFS